MPTYGTPGSTYGVATYGAAVPPQPDAFSLAPSAEISPPAFLTSLAGQRLWARLPLVDQTSLTLAAVCQKLGSELDLLYAALFAVPVQTAASAATWGLSNLEADYGLPPMDPTDTSDRRARVEALLRFPVAMTLYQLRQIAQAWVGNDVHGYVDAAASAFYVLYNGTAQPTDLVGFQQAITNAIHARLGLTFLQLWLIWSINDGWNSNQGPTWTEVDGLSDPAAGSGGYSWSSWDGMNAAYPPAGLVAG